MKLVVKAIDRSKLVLMPTQARTKTGGIAPAHRWKSPKAPEKKPLLAPNGKPSNLTPEQWKQVRTPEFKAWFGDSKVVDENGEPLVVYHGSSAEFDTFNRRYEKHKGYDFASADDARRNGKYGKGIFFSSNPNVSKNYTTVRSFFLKITNLSDNDLGGADYYDGILYDRDTGEKMLDDEGIPMRVSPDSLPDEMAESYLLDDSGKYDTGVVIRNIYERIPSKGKPEPLGDTWIVGNPNQIKSATANCGTFDSKNPNIYKSLTFSGHKLQDRMTIHGMDISIENKKGSVRRGVDKDGHAWRTKMHFAYGYVRGTVGKDKDHLDCYIGPDQKSEKVYIIHQNDPTTGKYDEDKVMLCFSSATEAKRAYLGQYDRPGFFGSMVETDIETFKKRAFSVGTKGKKLVVKAISLGLDMGEK